MPTLEHVLGLAIGTRSVQAVEVSRGPEGASLLAIDDWENTLLSSAPNDTPAGAERFQEYLSAFLKVNRIRARRAAIALDTSFLFIQTFPFDAEGQRKELLEHFGWELRQYRPESDPRDFITDTHQVSAGAGNSHALHIGVGVRRQHVQTIQRALTRAGLELHLVDADHFSADTALRVNYPDTHKRPMALVGIKDNRVDVSVIREGNLESYAHHAVRDNTDIVQSVARVAHEEHGILAISAYGPYLDRDLLVQIRRASPLLVEALNPLRHVSVVDTLRLSDHLSVPSYRFAAAVGAALRRD
jgi:Tfp pilus assembly PilM family ATPase